MKASVIALNVQIYACTVGKQLNKLGLLGMDSRRSFLKKNILWQRGMVDCVGLWAEGWAKIDEAKYEHVLSSLWSKFMEMHKKRF